VEHSKKMELVDRIIAVTSQKGVSSWINQIGEVAIQLELPVEFINWNNSPRIVAQTVMEQAADKEKLTQLADLLASLEADVFGDGAADLEIEDIPPAPEGALLVGYPKAGGHAQVLAWFDDTQKANEYAKEAYDGVAEGARKYKDWSVLHGWGNAVVLPMENVPHHNPVNPNAPNPQPQPNQIEAVFGIGNHPMPVAPIHAAAAPVPEPQIIQVIDAG